MVNVLFIWYVIFYLWLSAKKDEAIAVVMWKLLLDWEFAAVKYAFLLASVFFDYYLFMVD